MKPKVYYFGCINRSGHYLWDSVRNSLGYMETKKFTPWGNNIDGGIFHKSPDKGKEGCAHWSQHEGWTVVYYADYSVDKRGGSHSTFLVHSLTSADNLLNLAREQWPEVFNRPSAPLITFMK